MATRTFELTTTVDASAEAVIDFLIRLDGHRGIHPYLERAEVVASGSDERGPWWDWRIVERPRLGPLRYAIRFPARMWRLAPAAMRGSVRAAPGCTLVTVTTAEAREGGAIVSERTSVTAPALLVSYMAKHAQIAHARTFSKLADSLEK